MDLQFRQSRDGHLFSATIADGVQFRERFMLRPLLLAAVCCLIGAIVEAAVAGRLIKHRVANLRFPPMPPPLAMPVIQGAIYYLIFGAVLCHLFAAPASATRTEAICLALVVLVANGFWKYLYFRSGNLPASFYLSLAYSIVATVLLLVLATMHSPAAWWWMPYTTYLAYANLWTYALLCANALHRESLRMEVANLSPPETASSRRFLEQLLADCRRSDWPDSPYLMMKVEHLLAVLPSVDDRQ